MVGCKGIIGQDRAEGGIDQRYRILCHRGEIDRIAEGLYQVVIAALLAGEIDGQHDSAWAPQLLFDWRRHGELIEGGPFLLPGAQIGTRGRFRRQSDCGSVGRGKGAPIVARFSPIARIAAQGDGRHSGIIMVPNLKGGGAALLIGAELVKRQDDAARIVIGESGREKADFYSRRLGQGHRRKIHLEAFLHFAVPAAVPALAQQQARLGCRRGLIELFRAGQIDDLGIAECRRAPGLDPAVGDHRSLDQVKVPKHLVGPGPEVSTIGPGRQDDLEGDGGLIKETETLDIAGELLEIELTPGIAASIENAGVKGSEGSGRAEKQDEKPGTFHIVASSQRNNPDDNTTGVDRLEDAGISGLLKR
ncbi:MAG: hypothetical protein BWY77_01583 [bacterium ADurb.Bin431]|nr:MAG: hypothetical protein BWY77_01583 [bacterium ADurb.Bin431]